jgi:hypothetical protein
MDESSLVRRQQRKTGLEPSVEVVQTMEELRRKVKLVLVVMRLPEDGPLTMQQLRCVIDSG